MHFKVHIELVDIPRPPFHLGLLFPPGKRKIIYKNKNNKYSDIVKTGDMITAIFQHCNHWM